MAVRRPNPAKSDFQMVEKLCFRLLPVQVLLTAIGAINGMLCSLFASNFVGAHAMSAVGLYSPVRSFIGAVGTMLLGGSQILLGKYMGKKQQSDMQQVFSLNLIVSALFGLLMTVLITVAVTTGFTRIFTEDTQMLRYFDQYLLGVAVGILPQILGQQLSGYLSLENQGKYTLMASLGCIAATLVMNYVFLVVLRWEAFGLAIATSLGMWMFFIIESIFYLKKKSILQFRIRGIMWKKLKDILLTGLPGALTNGYMTLRGLAVNALIIRYAGAAGLSAFATSNAFLDIFWAIPAGMCAVSRMLISISTGEEDRNTLQNIMRVVFFRFLPIMTAVAALIIAFAAPCARLYYQDITSDVYASTVQGLRILPLCMPFSLICMHFVCYGQASDKHFLIHLMSVIDGVAAVVLFSALLTPTMGITGVYAANVLNGVTTTAIIFIYALFKNKKCPRNMEQLMVIPKDFGVPKHSRLDITVTNMEEVVNISRQVQQFCLDRGIDARRSYFAALAVEEMAGNVVEHGFRKDRKPHAVDLRIICKNNALTLHIKDDCKPFDPTEYRSMLYPEDPTKNMGLRMVFAISGDIKYQNLLGMNALTIHI